MLLSHLVIDVFCYVQMPLTTNNRLIKMSQNFQCVPKVTTSFGFSEQVTNCPVRGTKCCVPSFWGFLVVILHVLPGQCEIMPVKLQGLGVVVQVEVGIPQLTVDGTEHLQVLSTHLDGSFKE